MKDENVRASNFELLRLTSMFFIVIWHVIVHGNFMHNSQESTLLVTNFIMGIIIVHVNSLVFLTGYFSYDKTAINKNKIGKIIGEVWFYKLLSLIIFLLISTTTISKIMIGEELLPIDLNNYWFINCYLVIYILCPYLNKVIENMNEKDFFHFIIILILLLSWLPAISNGKIINNNGYNIINFTIMYYIGAFFKKYPLKKNYHFKNFSPKKIKYILLFLLIITIFSRIGLFYFGEKLMNVNSGFLAYIGKIIREDYFRYSSPLVIIQTTLYCLLFECFQLKNKIINYLAKSTFGIYLIHDNSLTRSYLYNALNVSGAGMWVKAIIKLLGYSVIILIGCFIIENIRIFGSNIIKKMYNKIKEKS